MSSNQEMPEIVYHYTSMDALLNIHATGVIWATNIRYLNDVSEREHFFSLIRSRAKPLNESGLIFPGLFDRVLEDNEEDKPFHDLPFVASFCRERDSLPQWRSYCPQGNGVCIGFATESLCKAYIGDPSKAKTGPMANAQFTFEPVQYLAKDDNNAADELLHKAMAEVDEQEKIIKAEDYPAKEDEEYAQEYEYEERQPMIEGPDLLYFALDKIASRTKHISFSSEGEYRLIVTTFFNLREMIKYRSSRSTLVPYVPVKLPNPDRFPSSHRVPKFAVHSPYFIDSVTVGPTPHPSLSADALAGLLMGHHVTIHKSEVPFRDW